MIIGIIIGIVLWQGVVALVYLITNEDDKLCCIWGTGIWYFILSYMIHLPYMFIQRMYRQHRYVAMMLNTNGEPCYCDSHEIPELLQEIGYKWNKAIMDKYTISDGWKEDQCVMGIVNLRYTPIKIAKTEGAYKVDKTIIEKAKKEKQSEVL